MSKNNNSAFFTVHMPIDAERLRKCREFFQLSHVTNDITNMTKYEFTNKQSVKDRGRTGPIPFSLPQFTTFSYTSTRFKI